MYFKIIYYYVVPKHLQELVKNGSVARPIFIGPNGTLG